MPDRLSLATAFVAALHAASKNPGSWWPARSIGHAAGIEDPDQLEQALRDAVTAGLVYRRVDDDCVLLTDKGRLLAATPIKPSSGRCDRR